jgi:hypothetical protein
MAIGKVLRAHSTRSNGLGVDQDVVDDLVGRPLQRSDELGRIIKLVKHEITNRIDGKPDIISARYTSKWQKASCFGQAFASPVRHTNVFVQVHAGQIAEGVRIAPQMHSPAFRLLRAGPGAEEAHCSDVDKRAPLEVDDYFGPIAAEDLGLAERSCQRRKRGDSRQCNRGHKSDHGT